MNYKCFFETIFKINSVFETHKPFRCSLYVNENGKVDLSYFIENNKPIKNVKINDIRGANFVLNKGKYDYDDMKETQQLELDYSLLSEDIFKKKYLYIITFLEELINNKYEVETSFIFDFTNHINHISEKELNDFLDLIRNKLSKDEISFLDKMMFNPFGVLFEEKIQKEFLKNFDEQLENGYTFFDENSKQNPDNDLEIWNYCKGQDNRNFIKYNFLSESKWSNRSMERYIDRLSRHLEVNQPPTPKRLQKNKIVASLQDLKKFTFDVSLSSGKAIKNKKPSKYILMQMNKIIEENKYNFFIGCQINTRNFDFDIYIDKAFVNKHGEEDTVSYLKKLIVDIINANELTYKDDMKNYKNIYLNFADLMNKVEDLYSTKSHDINKNKKSELTI